MTADPVRLVVFDLGRVLIQLVDDRAHAGRLSGVVIPEVPADVLQAWAAASHRHELGEIDCDAFCTAAASLVGLTADDHRTLASAWLRGPFPGVEAMVADLLDAGVQLACLSNTNDLHWAMMTTPGNPNFLPLDRFHHRFASHLLNLAKPDPAIYAHVERATDLPGPQIVFFDDLPANVEAARARGWRAHRIDPAAPDHAVAQARRVLATYDVLPRERRGA